MSEKKSPEDYVHGYCTDCGKRYSDQWMHSNAFAGQGSSPSCTSCGGVVGVFDSRNADREIAKSQRRRGISRETRPTVQSWEESGDTYEQPE